MDITIRTLTPLWTGGADRTSNYLRETGIIGSLRWWYEAIVRGLGGYVGDPASEDPNQRAEFDTSAYQAALRQEEAREEALRKGFRALGAVEYLFGATGWARLFRLRALSHPQVPLHFFSPVSANRSWLERIFGREESSGDYTIDPFRVFYGDLAFQIALRGHDTAYAKTQLAMLFRFVQDYGSLGAKPQHGFGQIANVTMSDELMALTSFEDGLRALRDKLGEGALRRDGAADENPFNLNNFFHQVYTLPAEVLPEYRTRDAHVGSDEKREESRYLPCAFDLRYRGSGEKGFRRWLEQRKNWDVAKLEAVMGDRSKNADAPASRVFFGMPYEVDDGYELTVFGFAPPKVISGESLAELCQEYVYEALGGEGAKLIGEKPGKDLLGCHGGGVV